MPHIHEHYDFTAAAYIVHPTEPKICLHFHRKLKSWLQIGGHIELNEDPLMALTHELEEEAGLKQGDYQFIELAEQPKAKKYKYIPLPMTINVHEITEKHKHIDIVFLVRAKTDRLKPQKGESQEIGWFNKDEVEQLFQKGVMKQGTYDTCLWIFRKLSTADLGSE